MADKKELNPSPRFPSGDYPELSPNPNQVDGLVNKTSEKPNTQFVNPERKQEKRCLTVSEVIELIIKYAPKGDTLPEVTSADNEKVLEVIAGTWSKGLPKANAITPPSSTTLTDEEIELISGGILMNGNFIGISNPQFYPSYDFGGALSGYVVGQNSSGQFVVCSYEINTTTKLIANTGTWIYFNQIGGRYIDIKGPAGALLYLNGSRKPQIEVNLTNLGTITSTETATGSGFYKNEILYTGGIGNEDVINVKMSNGAVYQAFNDTTNSKLVIYTGVDFATGSISVSKCWRLAY